MPPVSRHPTEHATGKLARKYFLIFFSIAIIPIGMILAVVYRNANWLLLQLSMLDQQRAVVLLISTVLIVAGLITLATRRLTRPINQLVHTIGLFAEGGWDQRANILGNDEIGVLARNFNQIADELCVLQHQMMIHENPVDDTRWQGSIQIARIVASSVDLNELLRDFLDLMITQVPCSYASIYFIERNEIAGTSYAHLAGGAGSLGLPEDHELNQRLKTDCIQLDTTATIEWLVGQAIASRRPQLGLYPEDTNIQEAALPIIQSFEGNKEQVLGVLDILVVNRVEENKLNPITDRVISEIQTMTRILAPGLIKFLGSHWITDRVADGKLSFFLPEWEIVLSTSRKIAEAENTGQIIQALCQALQISPFAYAVLLRPEASSVESTDQKIPMKVIDCQNSNRNRSFFSSTPPETLPSPLVDAVERYFFARGNKVVLISDINQAEQNLDSKPPRQTNPTLPIGLSEPAALKELFSIARTLGCRTVAFFPTVRNDKLLIILIIGSAADMPPLSGNPELLKLYRDLLNLTAIGLERIQSLQKTRRQFVELETFWQVSQAISVETDLKALYSLIHRQVEQAMGRISSFGIVLYDSNANQISIPYMIEEGEWLQIAPFPLGKGFSSEVIRTRLPLLMFTQREIDAKTLELDAMQVGDPPKSWLGVPMLFGGQVIGLIIVQDVKEEYRFTIQDERLLSMLATQVAVVVRNARLLEATRRQAQQERLTNEISDRIRRQVDVQSILKTTTDEISRVLGARQATMRIDTQVIGQDIPEVGSANNPNNSLGREIVG